MKRLLASLYVLFLSGLGCTYVTETTTTTGICGEDAAPDTPAIDAAPDALVVDAAPDAPVVDAAPDAQQACYAILATGDSNERGDGRTPDLTGSDVAYATPYTPVDEAVRIANGTANPPTWTEFSLSPTQPRTWVGIDRFGVELTLVRHLVASRPDVRWVFFKAAIGGTTLYDSWNPSNPTPSIFSNVHDWLDGRLAETGCVPVVYLWIHGGQDALQVSRAAAYGTRLTAFVNAVRVRYPGIPFVYGRLHNSSAYPYGASVRAGQEALSLPNVHMVDQDSGTLRSDGYHYTTPSVLSLGDLYYAPTILSVVPTASSPAHAP